MIPGSPFGTLSVCVIGHAKPEAGGAGGGVISIELSPSLQRALLLVEE